MFGASRAKMAMMGGTLGGLAPLCSMLLAGDEVSVLFLLGMAGETSFLSRKMVDLVQGGGRLYMLDGGTAVVERWDGWFLL
jgi:hypothetical protein